MPTSESDQEALQRLVVDGASSTIELSLPGSGGEPFPALATLCRHYGRLGAAPAVLVLGDSVSIRVAREDEDTRPLHRMIADSLPAASTAIVSSAYQGEIYRDLIRSLAVLPQKPSLIVIAVNLRSFSPQWHSNPLWELRQERDILNRFIDDPEMEIPPLEAVISEPGFFDRHDATPAESTFSNFKFNRDFRALSLARPTDERDAALRYRELFAWHYGYRFSETHPKLAALAEANAIATRVCGRVVNYLTPINLELGVKLLGPRFATHLAETAAAAIAGLSSEVKAGASQTLDLSSYLGSRYFFHGNLATEHLRETGRSKLARAVAEFAQFV